MPQILAPDGCALFYETGGAGPPVVLIPGLGGDGRFWNGVAARLRTRFLVIVVDHRGAGRSARPLQDYTIDGIAADVRAVMDAEGVARAHVVGHSTGGAVAMSMALDTPERVDRLVLSGTWARPDARFRMLFQARLEVLRGAGPACYQALTHVLGYPPAYLAAHEAELHAAAAAADQALAPLAEARIRMLLAHDRGDEISGIRAPTLVIGAPDDEMIPFHHAPALARLIPGSRLARLAGGHFHPRTDPEPFAEAAAGFLSDAASATDRA